MCKILSENHILKSEEIGLSHEGSHYAMDQVNIILRLYNSVHVYVDHNVETIVYVRPYKSKDKFEYFGSDIILHLAHIDPFECCLEIHGLCLRQNKLPIEDTNSESFQVDFMKQLHNQLEDLTDPRQDFLLSSNELTTGQELSKDEIQLIDLFLDRLYLFQYALVVGVISNHLNILFVLSGLLNDCDGCLFLLVKKLIILLRQLLHVQLTAT